MKNTFTEERSLLSVFHKWDLMSLWFQQHVATTPPAVATMDIMIEGFSIREKYRRRL